MPRLAIVIDDPQKAHAADLERNIHANLQHLKGSRVGMGPQEAAALKTRVTDLVRARTGPAREAGDLHTVVDTECPDGLPNCRHCGDPAHEATCQAAGHCRCCGRSAHVPGLLAPPVGRGGHGVAPEEYLAATGMVALDIETPAEGETWDREKRSFRQG